MVVVFLISLSGQHHQSQLVEDDVTGVEENLMHTKLCMTLNQISGM
jgi:hypothetical protein